MSVIEELQRPEELERLRDRDIGERPEEVDHTQEELGLTWHCGHHSLCTLEGSGFPSQFQQQLYRVPQSCPREFLFSLSPADL